MTDKCWTEDDVTRLIRDQVQESTTLDYKRSDALSRDEKKKTELSKDVSALANSAGGVLLYGVIENKHYPTSIDAGYDPNDISKEWIEQILTSCIAPKIEGLRIDQIRIGGSNGSGRVLYAIHVPQASTRAPHQAKDKRYYRRYNFESVPMEDYEIRDLSRRASSPDLMVNFYFSPDGKVRSNSTTVNFMGEQENSNPISLAISVSNRSPQPADYAVFRIFVDEQIRVSDWSELKPVGHFNIGTNRLVAGSLNWASPSKMPIFSEIDFSLTNNPLLITLHSSKLSVPEFVLGYDVRAPGFSSTQFCKITQSRPATLRIEQP